MIERTEEEIMKNWQGDISKPVVSVCTITYNHEKYIAEAIDSFLIQETDFPFEVVVDDDCSTDNNAKIIKEYADKFPNIIKANLREKNVGMYRNGQENMQRAQGKYIALCEGDDYWTDAKKLQIQKDFLENNDNYAITYSSVKGFNAKGIVKNYRGGATKDLSQEELQQATPINTLTAMFRNLIRDFPPEMCSSKYGDLFFWAILGYHGKGKYIEQIKPSMYRIHPGGVHSSLSDIDIYDNTLVTYSLLMLYHKRKKNQKMVCFFKKKIILTIKQTNGYIFMIQIILKDFVLQKYYFVKLLLKNILRLK